MDDKELELQEFDLDDILQEFGDEPLPESEDDGEDELFVSEEEEEDLSDSEGDVTTYQPGVRDTIRIPTVADDATIRMPNLTDDATIRLPGRITDDTIRLDDLPGAETEEEEEEEPVPVQPSKPAKEKPEPFSNQWEPEYEQPMGEYIPPQPIIFRPRSRLREMKRKLIAGPERRYYELSEQGVGKLQAAIFLSLLVVILSAGATVLHAMELVGENRMRLLVFSQFFAMLVSALLGSFQLIEGVADIFRKRFSLNSLLVFTFAACFADGVMCLQQLRIPCCAAFSLQVTMSLWSAYQERNTEMGQMDTMRKAIRLDGILPASDYFEGKTGLLRDEGQVEDFMENYNVPSTPEKVRSIYALLALVFSCVIGGVAAALHDTQTGIQVLAVSLLAAVPASFFVTLSRPMAVLEKRLHRLGAVLCGWQGVKQMSGKVVFPLSYEDIFPAGTVNVNGVKFYGSRDTDEVVEYSAALISAGGGGLVGLFTQMLESRNGRHFEVENFRAYPGGIGGEICGESVLMGTQSFLKDMGVDMPDGIRVNQAVYVAVDGELCGLYAITYDKSKVTAAGMTTLCAYKGLKPVLTTVDFMLSEGFLRARFGVNTRRMAFPERDVRMELAERKPDKEAMALAMATQPGLMPMAYAVTGARALRTASIAGMAVHMLGGILGLVMMATLAVSGGTHLLTPVNLFLYELIWIVPGLLITEWTRSI